MAKYGKTLAQVTVEINGKKQAEQVLKAMTTAAAEMRNNIRSAKNELEQLALAGGGPAYDAKKKEVLGMEKELKQLERSIRETKKFSEDVGSILDNMSKNSATTLTRTKRALESLLSSIVPSTKKAQNQIEFLQKAIKQVTDEIARRKGQITEFDDIMGNLGKATPKQLDAVEKRLQSLLDSVTKNSSAWRKYNKELRIVQDEKASRKKSEMESQMENVAKLSVSARNELKKYWQSVNDGAKQGSKSFRESLKNLQEIDRVETEMATKQAKKVLSAPKKYSVGEINDAIKVAEQMQTDTKSKIEWADLAEQIAKAKEVRDSFADSAKLKVMSEQFKNVKDLSFNALAEQKKYWTEIKNSLTESDPLYKKAIANLEQMDKIETDRMKHQSTETLTTNLNTSGTADIKQAVDWLTKYQSTLEPLSKEWQDINDLITSGNDRLKDISDTAKFNAMNQQFANLRSLSKSALAEQKKYWQSLFDSLDVSDSKFATARDNLDEIKDWEKLNIDRSAIPYINNAISGSWDKTIEETEEAIKLIQEYKKQLKTETDAPLIQEANEAIEILNRNLGKAKEALMDIQDAKRIAQEVSEGSFNGTAEDIEKAKKALEEYRKTLKLSGEASEVEKVDRMLNNLARSAELGGKNLKDLDAVLGDLKHASMDDLQTAAKQLQQELQGATRSTEDYVKTAEKLRRVNREMERTRQEWEGQESLFVRMTRRLSVYMAAYGSLSFIVDKVKELGQSNLQLSDSIADVAKTTGLEADELAKLGKEIRAIDTRTAQEQLYELAAAAGQLGIKSETEIAGFVRAANMITVSLNELGTEATTQLMKIATLTGEAQEGTETALLSIGSAINELTASSAAAAGPIVDLMNRMGGIAAQSGITSAQMAAIGATADALGQSVEITGTSMNKFLATLMSSSNQIAYALNMDAKALRSLLNEGRTMDAVIAVFEKMNQMGGLGALAPIMGELGSEGARMTQVLAAMAEKVDFLKGQLDISTKAYEEAISIQNEYNVKNENAIAILQRMGNAIKEFFVNNVVVDIITAVLRAMYKFFSYLGEGTVGAKALASALVLLTTALISTRIQWVRTINEMNRVEVFRSIQLWLKNLTTGTLSLSAAMSKLGKALKANWFSILIGAVAGLATWMIKAATYVSEAAKATAKYNRELQEEKNKVDQLFNSLKRLNTSESDRARIINSINQQYSQYLGFMLDEKDSAEKLAAAHQLINAELRKRMALNLQNTLTGKANNEYAEHLEKTIAGIAQKVENIKVRITKDNGQSEDRELYTYDVLNTVSEMINDRVYESVKVTQEEVNGQIVHRQQMGTVDLDKLKADIRAALEKEFENVRTYDANGNIIKGDKTFTGQLVFGNIESYIKSMLEERIKYQKSIINAENQANIELRSATKAVLKQRENISNELTTEIENAQNDSEKLEANLQAADKALKSAKAAAEKYAKDDKSKGAETARENLTKAQQNYAKEERILKDHYEKIADNAYDYIDNQKEILKEHYSNIDDIKDENLRKQMESERDAINAQIEEYTNIAKEAAKKVPGFDPWDKERDVKDWREFSEIVTNLDSSSAKALAAAFKKIKDEAALFPDDVQKVYELFQSQGVDKISLEKLGLTDAKSVADLVYDWEKQIREKLRTKFHRNTTLGFIFDEGNGRDMKAKARQDYQAAMSALEAYYKEYEDFIRQNRENLLITESEMNRQLLDNERKYNEDKQQLIKKFLGEENSFNQTKYVGILSNYDYFGMKDLDKMAKQYQQWGDAMTDGGRNQIAKAGVEIRKALNKEQEKVKTELLKGDMFETFENNFAEMLDELGILTSNLEDEVNRVSTKVNQDAGINKVFGLSPDERQKRIEALTKFADQSYQINENQLRDLMAQNTQFVLWANNLSDEEMTVLLGKLRNYYDDRIELTRKYQDQLAKEFESYYQQIGKQGEYEAKKQGIDKSNEEREQLESFGITRGVDYYGKRKDVAKEYQNENDVLSDKAAFLKERLATLQEGSAEYIATQKLITDTELAQNQLLADSQRELTQVYMEEWTKRAERWGQWGEIFGEYLGEQVMLEKQANDARARGDLETAKKIEQQQKQNKQALIQNLLSKIVDEAALWAKEYALKMMFNSLMLAEDKKKAIEEMSLEGKKSTLSIFLSALTGQASEHKKGLSGLVTGAIIFAATMALQALAKSAIANMFPEAASGSTSNRKLSTGMLTYAEGNYPVLGNDGKVYDAKYEGAGMKTGIYGGGAHFGIFSEKQPEMIVDGKTTQKLILNYPYIYDAITTIAKNGRLVNAMPTFASGDYPAGMNRIAQVEAVDISGGSNEDMIQMRATMEETREVNRQLLAILSSGRIVAHLDGLENHRQQKKNERFLNRRGIN
jgi:TP901 family phage tail tape measure protein